ncbi:unnamed protein product [Fusarium venenatum]|uniref:Uncharacterized protein n=1 Tax=Fusarium venenatum TaxID=56646 RepID=A0A2L2TAI2_9HYPO|nr:uncharacterized protein FVRRES_03401 [Fusarium venenatum]CEI66889.1 unnamed protein product [Fusarium venenatum]
MRQHQKNPSVPSQVLGTIVMPQPLVQNMTRSVFEATVVKSASLSRFFSGFSSSSIFLAPKYLGRNVRVKDCGYASGSKACFYTNDE